MAIDPTELPINKALGLQWHMESDFIFSLRKVPATENFFGTIHAAAIYALVDATSGELLQRAITLDLDRHFAVNRETVLKIKRPSKQLIKARGHILDKDISNLEIESIEARPRRFRVDVEVFNEDDEIAAIAQVSWFLGKQ